MMITLESKMKNYVLCTTLEEHSINTLKNLKHTIDIKDTRIHIISIVEVKYYNLDFIPYIYPTENQYAEIENSAKMLMQSLAKSLEIKNENLVIDCFFDSYREQKIKNYLEETKADLVVTATRGKHGIDGFFSSSFSDYLCKFSPCDVLVMRPLKN
jgi:nucleotide-binding universal stress UspA family protein